MTAGDFIQRPGRAEPIGNRSRLVSWRTRLPAGLRLATVTALLAAVLAGSLARLGSEPSAVAAPRAPIPTLQRFPVDGSCWYTDTWMAPRSGGRLHEGVDIGAAGGTPLLAVADGRIAKMYSEQPNWKGGNAIRLTTADGTYFFYGHLQGFAEGLAVGAPVTAGQVIGYVGKTGNAGVDHLHFEVHPGGGAAVNPYPIVKAVNTCSSSGRAATPTAAPTATTVAAPGATTPPAGTPSGFVGGFTPAPVGSPGCVATHTVEAGDYWFLIAARFAVNVKRLTAANGRNIESWIFPAEVLCVPSAEWVAPTTTVPPTTAPPTTAAALPPAPGAAPTTVAGERPKAIPKDQCKAIYLVKANDYWVLIGELYKRRPSRVAAANGKLLTDPIYPGDKVCIPY
jgi:hypothetical protein